MEGGSRVHSEVVKAMGSELLEIIESGYQNNEKAKLMFELEKITSEYQTELHSLRLKQHLQ
jgi:hypothetical protein